MARSEPTEARSRLEAINTRLRELNADLPEVERVALIDVDRLLGDRDQRS